MSAVSAQIRHVTGCSTCQPYSGPSRRTVEAADPPPSAGAALRREGPSRAGTGLTRGDRTPLAAAASALPGRRGGILRGGERSRAGSFLPCGERKKRRRRRRSRRRGAARRTPRSVRVARSGPVQQARARGCAGSLSCREVICASVVSEDNFCFLCSPSRDHQSR